MVELENLQVWQLGIDLTKKVYEKTSGFPKNEIFGLTSQMRRAASSIPSNVAEGKGRGTVKDFTHFLTIAKGSAYELKTQVEIAKHLGLLSKEIYDEINDDIESLVKKLNGLIFSLKKHSPQERK